MAELNITVNSRQLTNLRRELDLAARAGIRTQRSADALGRETRQMGRQMGQAQRQVERMTRSTTAMGASMTGAGLAARTALTSIGGLLAIGGITQVFRAAVGAHEEFTASLSELSAITGAAGADLAFYEEQSKQIGATTTLSASQAVTAFKLIASAKPDLLSSRDDLAAVTREAVALAEASGLELPQAAAALGSSLNQFGAGAEQASRFINVLAAGSKFGSSEINRTALALKEVGTVASAAGLSFEETNAAIQALGNVAIFGSQAGTQLRNIILRLQKTGEEELDPTIHGLIGALRNLNKRNLEATDLMRIFGLESTAAAQALLNQLEAMGLLNDRLTGTNTAYEQAATRVDNLRGDFAQLFSVIESVGLNALGAFDTTLRDTVQSLTAVLGQVNDLITAFRNFGTAAAIGEVNEINEAVTSRVAQLEALSRRRVEAVEAQQDGGFSAIFGASVESIDRQIREVSEGLQPYLRQQQQLLELTSPPPATPEQPPPTSPDEQGGIQELLGGQIVRDAQRAFDSRQDQLEQEGDLQEFLGEQIVRNAKANLDIQLRQKQEERELQEFLGNQIIEHARRTYTQGLESQQEQAELQEFLGNQIVEQSRRTYQRRVELEQEQADLQEFLGKQAVENASVNLRIREEREREQADLQESLGRQIVETARVNYARRLANQQEEAESQESLGRQIVETARTNYDLRLSREREEGDLQEFVGQQIVEQSQRNYTRALEAEREQGELQEFLGQQIVEQARRTYARALEDEQELGEAQETLGRQIVETARLNYQLRLDREREQAEIQELLGEQIVEEATQAYQRRLALEQEQNELQEFLGRQAIENARVNLEIRRRQAQEAQALQQRQTEGPLRDAIVSAQADREVLDVQIRAAETRREELRLGQESIRVQQQLVVLNQELNALQITRTQEAFNAANTEVERLQISEDLRALQSQRNTLAAQELRLSQSSLQVQQEISNEREGGGIFGGLAQGFSDFANDTESAFGLARQTALNSARSMQRGFQSIFFDAMDGRIRSFADGFRALEQVAKQVASNIIGAFASFAIQNILFGGGGQGGGLLGSLLGSVASGVAGGIGGGAAASVGTSQVGRFALPGFQTGGIVPGSGNRDNVVIRATPGEGILNRRGVEALGRLNNGEATQGRSAGPTVIDVKIINNSGERVQTRRSQNPSGTGLEVMVGQIVEDQILNDTGVGRTIREQYGLDRVGVRR